MEFETDNSVLNAYNHIILNNSADLLGDDLYIDNNPDVDAAEILGRWSGTADHSTLVALLDQPAGLAEGALQLEFADGVDRYLWLCGRADRQKLLAEVRKEPSREKFAAFWTAKRAAGSAADEGNNA